VLFGDSKRTRSWELTSEKPVRKEESGNRKVLFLGSSFAQLLLVEILN
jgi:hypothetical protein